MAAGQKQDHGSRQHPPPACGECIACRWLASDGARAPQVMMVVFDILGSHQQMQHWHSDRLVEHQLDMRALQAAKAQLAEAVSASKTEGEASVAGSASNPPLPEQQGHHAALDSAGPLVDADGHALLETGSRAAHPGTANGHSTALLSADDESALLVSSPTAQTPELPVQAVAAAPVPARETAALPKSVAALAKHRRVLSAGSHLDRAPSPVRGSPLANGHARAASVDDFAARLEPDEAAASPSSRSTALQPSLSLATVCPMAMSCWLRQGLLHNTCSALRHA